MSKVIDCNKVAPASGCNHAVRGETEEELMRNAQQHAKEHGLTEVTPELLQTIRENMRDE